MWDLVAAALNGFPIKDDPYYAALDQAIRDRFPGVECQTYRCSGFDLQTVTRWWKAGTDHELLSNYKAKQVRLFSEGWVAGYAKAKDAPT